MQHTHITCESRGEDVLRNNRILESKEAANPNTQIWLDNVRALYKADPTSRSNYPGLAIRLRLFDWIRVYGCLRGANPARQGTVGNPILYREIGLRIRSVSGKLASSPLVALLE